MVLEDLAALRLELSGSYYAKQSLALPQMDVGGDFKLLRFGARVCRVWALGAFDLAPCLGAQFYRIKGVGFGANALTHSGQNLVWGPALGVFGRLRLLESFAIYIAADGVIAISTRSFVVAGVAELHRASSFAFQLFVAPEVLF